MKKYAFTLGSLLLIGLCSTLAAADGSTAAGAAFPLPIEAYNDSHIKGLWEVLVHRVSVAPFNLVATIIFLCAVVHTFIAYKFELRAKVHQKRHEAFLKEDKGKTKPLDSVCFRAEVYHFLGEVEAIFGIWVVPLLIAAVFYYGWTNAIFYIDKMVVYDEPVFVVIIMTIAATRPILRFAENAMRQIAKLGKSSPLAWWFTILTVGPILGSFITEPAAMTISALLLGSRFYDLHPSAKFSYATLGLLFVNVSVGGTLTHFAAPPVLMVAGKWGWDIPFMLTNFGWKAVIGILSANTLYWFIFREEFKILAKRAQDRQESLSEAMGEGEVRKTHPIPVLVTIVHMLFLAWTVSNLHHMPIFVGGFLFFLAFTQVTLHHQYVLRLRTPLLVGFFLAGLVIHGGLQQWWIEPLLSRLSEVPLFLGATVLTAFNDNAAITFLASLVPEFASDVTLQKAVVEGAVTGGGLTIIANAPNPAGRSILAKYFQDGLSPINLLFGALTPTAIMACAFMLLP